MPAKKAVKAEKPRSAARTEAEEGVFILRLYVAGTTPLSSRAIVDARRICEQHLHDRYRLEVIDIYQRPTLAMDEQIIAVPTLVRHLPPPLRRIVGDLSNCTRVLIGLDLVSEEDLKRPSVPPA